jgi:hypothetical protein
MVRQELGLFLLNAGGQNVELSADNSAALNAILRR